jgi:hypothetical protein
MSAFLIVLDPLLISARSCTCWSTSTSLCMQANSS